MKKSKFDIKQVRNKLRDKNFYNTELQEIFGVGKTTIKSYFGEAIIEKKYSCRDKYVFDGNKIIEIIKNQDR